MSSRTISIGGATYDLFVLTDSREVQTLNNRKVFALPLGEKIRVRNVIETCGGGASNTSVGLARLGCQAHFSGILSSDQWGEKLAKNFEREGVDIASATIVEDEVSSFSLILTSENGERVILYEPGVNAHLQDANFNREAVAQMDWVYLNHIQERTCIIQDDLVHILTRQEHTRFTWNPGGCQLELGMNEEHNAELLAHTDLLLVNREEAQRLSRTESMEEAMHALGTTGAKIICITDGSRGTTATDGTYRYHCPTIGSAEVVDTTGAGDAFGTGATWALLQGFDLPTALRAGTINASSVVGALGAQTGLLTDTQMHKRLSNTQLDVEVSPLR